MAATKLSAPNGATVSVDSERVETLLRFGFTKASAKETGDTTKTTAKKASPKKSSK